SAGAPVRGAGRGGEGADRGDRRRSAARGLIAALLLVAAACSKSQPPPPPKDDPAPRDKARLAAIVAADEAFDKALAQADDAERAGDDAKAAGLLRNEATKAADDALAEAAREPLETSWAIA